VVFSKSAFTVGVNGGATGITLGTGVGGTGDDGETWND